MAVSKPFGFLDRKPCISLAVPIFAVALFALATPAAFAYKSVKSHKKHKTHLSKQNTINVSMPEEGYLLDEDDPLLPYLPILFADQPQYELKVDRQRNEESLDIVYRIGDFYLPDALDNLDYFLRDNHDETISECDPQLFDLLHTLLARAGKPDGTISMLSGYRTQETNDYLRENQRTNAAEYSQHLYGRAIDIRIAGVTAARLRNAALAMKAGGVGYYPRGQFIHVDVGPVRHWTYVPHRRRRFIHRKKKTKNQ